MKILRLIFGLAFAALLSTSFVDLAVAQSQPVPKVTSVAPADLFADVVNGSPTAQSQFATAAQIAGVPGYSYQIPVTAFTITAGNATALLFLAPAGTLATGTLTMAASPGDGQRFCLSDTQTQTAITISANTGQSLGGITAPTALVAGTNYCWVYDAALATWLRYL